MRFGSWRGMYLSSASRAAIARFHVSNCRSSGEPTAVESCLQELVDEGEIEPSAVVEYRCEVANQPLDVGDSFTAERAFRVGFRARF